MGHFQKGFTEVTEQFPLPLGGVQLCYLKFLFPFKKYFKERIHTFHHLTRGKFPGKIIRVCELLKKRNRP